MRAFLDQDDRRARPRGSDSRRHAGGRGTDDGYILGAQN